MSTVEIQNIKFHNNSMSEFIDIFNSRMKKQEKTFIVTANPELVYFANREPKYFDTLNHADYILPDGIGVVIASKIINKPLKERVAGFDLMGELLKKAENENLKVYFLGAKESTLEKAYNNIQYQHPKLNIVGKHHGYIDVSDEELVQEMIELEPDLVFVGLGFPKQEYWIETHISRFKKGLFMGVGGSFDVWGGDAKRAPQKWIDLHLEWLYRLIKQPTRFKRMLVLPQFIMKVIVERR